MKKDYSRFEYRITYDFVLKGDGKTKNEKIRDAACFYDAFHSLTGINSIYSGQYTLECRKTFDKQYSNFCALEKPDILKLLRYMRRVFDIKIHLVESEDWYTFVLTIEGKPIKHKWVLTFCRIFFEFPYNEMACDVIKLRKQGIIDGIDFTHKGFLELFHLINASYREGIGMYNGHSLFAYPKTSISTKTLKESFINGLARVQDIYQGNYIYFNKLSRVPDSYRKINWDKDFESRLKYYIANFYKLKQLRKDEKGVRRRARKVV